MGLSLLQQESGIMHVFMHIWLIAVLAGRAHCEQWYQVGNPHFLDTTSVFPAIKDTSTIKILKFFSPWCRYCRYMKNYMDNYKSSHQVSPSLKFYDFDCSKNGPSFCWEHFQVRAYPCVLFIDEKGERVSRFDGLYPQDVINNVLDQFNKKAAALGGSGQEKKKEESVEEKKEEMKEEKKDQEKPKEEEKKQQPKAKEAEEVKKQEAPKQEPKQEPKEQPKVQQPKVQPKEQPKAEPKEQGPAPQPKQQQKRPPVTQRLKPRLKPTKPLEKPQVQQIKPETVQPIPQPQPQPTPIAQPTVPQSKQPDKIDKSQTSEESVEKETKIDPADVGKEGKFVQEQGQSSSSYQFVKYLLYLVGISIGVLYAIKIFTSRSQEQTMSKPIPKGAKTGTQGQKKPHKITTQDIQNQILVQQIPDQHL